MGALNGILTQLGVNNSLFLMVVFFVVAYAILKFLFLAPLSNDLVERDERTAGRLRESLKITEEVETLTEKFDASLLEVRKEASKKLNTIKEKALERQRVILAEARSQAQKQVEEAQSKITSIFEGEKKKLASEVPELADGILQSFLLQKKKLNSSEDKKDTGRKRV